MKQPLKEKLKAIGGGHLLKEGYAWERKFGEKLPTLDSVQNKHQQKINEEIIEWERIDDLEARIFDQIIDFKKTFEKSEWKKNRQVNAIIKQFIKLEVRLSQAVRDANK